MANQGQSCIPPTLPWDVFRRTGRPLSPRPQQLRAGPAITVTKSLPRADQPKKDGIFSGSCLPGDASSLKQAVNSTAFLFKGYSPFGEDLRCHLWQGPCIPPWLCLFLKEGCNLGASESERGRGVEGRARERKQKGWLEPCLGIHLCYWSCPQEMLAFPGFFRAQVKVGWVPPRGTL